VSVTLGVGSHYCEKQDCFGSNCWLPVFIPDVGAVQSKLEDMVANRYRDRNLCRDHNSLRQNKLLCFQ